MDEKIIEKLLDEFEEEHGSLDETSWEEIDLIKRALWCGYKFKLKSQS